MYSRKYRAFRAGIESLEPRIAQSGLTAISDPLPQPEGPPIPDNGNDNPPVVYPILPPGGPSGPGS